VDAEGAIPLLTPSIVSLQRCDMSALEQTQWVEVSDAGEAAFRKRAAEAKA